jgi:lipopolysaccharide transport protein LptA
MAASSTNRPAARPLTAPAVIGFGGRTVPTLDVRAPSVCGIRALWVLAAALALLPPRATAAAPGKQDKEGGTITLDAASSEVDLRTNNVYFRKVRIAQGSMSVTADQGQATREGIGNFENSLWQFHSNVKITTEDGQLQADEAQVDFAKRLLSRAVAHGKPAEFQERIEKTGKLVHGHAENIDYDATKGLVVLSKGAWLSDGQNEVTHDSLKFDLQAQRIIADPGEQESQRVHIIITPPPSKP